MKKNQEIQIRLKEINEISFTLTQILIPTDQIEFGLNLSLRIGFRFDINMEQEMFKFYTSISYLIENQEKPIVELESEIVFEIYNMSLVVSPEGEEKLKIEDSLLETLAGVCIGTNRGLLAANVKDTPMKKFPLPVLNPQRVLKEMNYLRE
jgi:hypothetical protein